MIKRIVKLTFQEDKIDTFLRIFKDSKSKIRASQGCHHVELLQGMDQGNIFFTFSIWENEEALNTYRQSDLFRKTWAKTKVLFIDKPQVWSVNFIDEA
ncbi:MAG: heme-degrading monooxygenase HmoA [Saprospiraceae bacterium]|jgi:heme-degrading monooxygenase HmoA